MAPPNDDHGCDWKEYAKHLAEQLAVLKAQVEKLEREKFGSKSEKMGKMPPVPRPAKDPQETAALRKALALLRVERVETDERPPTVVPEADKKCTVCGGTNFRPVGEGKTCTIYEYVPGYLRRVVLTRRVKRWHAAAASASSRHRLLRDGPTERSTLRASSRT